MGTRVWRGPSRAPNRVQDGGGPGRALLGVKRETREELANVHGVYLLEGWSVKRIGGFPRNRGGRGDLKGGRGGGGSRPWGPACGMTWVQTSAV